MSGETSWTVVVAVKPLRHGKSRLRPQMAGHERLALVAAMATDVVSSVVATPGVARCIVVTADIEGFAPLVAVGAELLREPTMSGLNAAFRLARDQVGDGALAMLTADIPALTPGELTRALAMVAAEGREGVGMVSDRQGSGTTMLAATRRSLVLPQFGPDSRRRHVQAGAIDYGPWCGDGLRRDIDTVEDLTALAQMGTAGSATSAWLSDLPVRRLA